MKTEAALEAAAESASTFRALSLAVEKTAVKSLSEQRCPRPQGGRPRGRTDAADGKAASART